MTSRVVRMGPGDKDPGKLKEIIISCDQMDCYTAVNDEQIRVGGGLKEMGWTTGTAEGYELRHYCPEHKR